MEARTRRFIALLLALAIPALVLAACGSSGASSSPRTTAKVAGSVATSTIPAGTVLRIGEQLSNLKTVLSISGEDQNLPYQVQYSEFVGGPPMLQAFQGGALDVGFVYSTPLIFAQAANQDLTAVASWASTGSGYALVSAPGASSIKSWANLKGKRVAYQVGTASEAVLLEGLQSAGLSLSDVTTVNLPTTQIAAALQGGSADAGITVEPLLSVYLAANPTAHVITYATKITDRSGFLIATTSALGDKAKSAALADYISRLVKAYKYLNAHPQKIIQAVYVDQYGLTLTRAAAVAKLVGSTSFVQLPGAIELAQQNLANLFFTAGVIPTKVDVAKEFDSRFNDLIASVQGS
jgi:sulfonate transport system substrate-binding protein